MYRLAESLLLKVDRRLGPENRLKVDSEQLKIPKKDSSKIEGRKVTNKIRLLEKKGVNLIWGRMQQKKCENYYKQDNVDFLSQYTYNKFVDIPLIRESFSDPVKPSPRF